MAQVNQFGTFTETFVQVNEMTSFSNLQQKLSK